MYVSYQSTANLAIDPSSLSAMNDFEVRTSSERTRPAGTDTDPGHLGIKLDIGKRASSSPLCGFTSLRYDAFSLFSCLCEIYGHDTRIDDQAGAVGAYVRTMR